MIVKGYRTLFHRGQRDVSDSVRLVLSRIDPVFTVSMPTLQPREEMKISVRNGATYANYISIEYDSNEEPQPFRQVWYYFAEYDPGSPSTPANTAFSLYADWWAMSVDWWGEDPVGIRIKRGHLTRSHQFLIGDHNGENTTLSNAPANPRKLISIQKPSFASIADGAAIVALYHVNGSIFSLPGTDRYLQVIVPLSAEESTKIAVADSLAYLANGKIVTYTINYTDEEGKAQTYTETPDISECAGLWVIPKWIFQRMLAYHPETLMDASVGCHIGDATSAVVPIGVGRSKTFSAWAVASDYSDNANVTISGDLKHFRYFGNPGANIVLPCTLDTLNGVIMTRFSMAQQSFSVKFAVAGSIVDATNSFAVNINKDNANIQFRNDIIKGGISTIVTALGIIAGGPGGAALALSGATGAARTISAGIGLANDSRHSEGMDGLENMVAVDYSTTAANKYIYGCAVVTYDSDNKSAVEDECNDFGALGNADIDWITRDEIHKYNFYQLDDLDIGTESTSCEPARRAIREMLLDGVRIWDDIQATNFLTVKSWQ